MGEVVSAIGASPSAPDRPSLLTPLPAPNSVFERDRDPAHLHHVRPCARHRRRRTGLRQRPASLLLSWVALASAHPSPPVPQISTRA